MVQSMSNRNNKTVKEENADIKGYITEGRVKESLEKKVKTNGNKIQKS